MEEQFINWLRTRCPATKDIPLGLEDDAALLLPGGDKLVLTVDTLAEGVDFLLDDSVLGALETITGPPDSATLKPSSLAQDRENSSGTESTRKELHEEIASLSHEMRSITRDLNSLSQESESREEDSSRQKKITTLPTITLGQAGRKALAVNLSDLAAMAAVPWAYFVSLLLPRSHAEETARSLYEGLFPLADEFKITLAGGDTNTWDSPLSITICAIGKVGLKKPLLRSSARSGDKLLVTGPLGGSLLGRHHTFQPRVREAILLNEQYQIHAAMDISDGLALDLSRMMSVAKKGAILDAESIPISPAAERMALIDGRPPLEHALGDGEDFELLLAVPPEEAEKLLRDQPLRLLSLEESEGFLYPLGEVVDGEKLFLREKGVLRPLPPVGWQY